MAFPHQLDCLPRPVLTNEEQGLRNSLPAQWAARESGPCKNVTVEHMSPHSVFCIIEQAHRDRPTAEAVCMGRFTHAGITLDLGSEPDWLHTAFPTDAEWRIEWSKFYYGLDLAHAFSETGERRFLDTWQRLVRSWIRQVPVNFDPSDVIGRRIQNWIYAWTLFANAPQFPGLTDGFDREILASLAAQVQYLRSYLTPERNHRTLELYALFIAALALPQLDPDRTLLDFSMTELHHNVLTDLWADGVHRECSTHYHMIVLRSLLGARENARHFGLSFPTDYDARLARACEFALHIHRPDGTIPAFSDSDTGSYVDILALAAILLGRPDFLYGATGGVHGIPPQRRYVSFPQGGYLIQRSGWGTASTPFAQERFLMFDCGPLGDGGHGHYDLLNVEIAGGGRPLIVDPGRYTYDEGMPNWRQWFKGTTAHNTVCVDGLDQTPYRRGKPKKQIAQGRFVRRLSAPGLDVLCGEVVSPVYEAVHKREIVFVADEYWLIADRLHGQYPHHYNLRYHLTPEAWNRTIITVGADNTVVRAPGVALVFPQGVAVSLEPGWVSLTYGEKLPAPIVSVVSEGKANTEFLTLIIPLNEGEPVPSLHLVTPLESSSARVVEVTGVGPGLTHRDCIAWSPTIAPLTVGSLRCHASAAWVRESESGTGVTFRACDVANLTWISHTASAALASATPCSWVMWDQQHGIVQGQGEEL